MAAPHLHRQLPERLLLNRQLIATPCCIYQHMQPLLLPLHTLKQRGHLQKYAVFRSIMLHTGCGL
jgi:hypothetical protein